MTTVKRILKKLMTLDGVVKVLIVLFMMNLTHFGREIRSKIESMFKKGMGGI